MSDSIYNLIKENRKLFYTGKIRNKYKAENHLADHSINSQDVYTISKEPKGKQSFSEKSMSILQEIFSE